jgi:type VI secretion system secreted protein VgrG
MNSKLTQDNQVAKVDTPFGKDVLVLERFDGQEGLGELFEYQIQALSERNDLDFDQAIGKGCSVTHKAFGVERVFHGVLVEAQWLGPRDNFWGYSLVLRPWLWLLSRTADCRIFQNQTAPDIIQKVFHDRGFTDIRASLTESYPTLEYCVQYRETDLAFVSRLMEQHGIYYFFEHSADKHVLVLSDAKSSHAPVPNRPTLPFVAYGSESSPDKEHVVSWVSYRRFCTGKVEYNDYDYLKPSASLISDANGSAGYTRSNMEVYDYPGKYTKPADGKKYAKVLLEAEQAIDKRRFGSGQAASLFPGGLTTLEKHTKSDENAEYLIVRCSHSITIGTYRSGRGDDETYHGSYEFQPSDVVFRSPLITPEPRIYGAQTATVVGNSGEEIDVDKYGRIWVQFHWDREGKKDRNSSCPIRVAQVWSGKQWGGVFIPRIGMEVVVEFLEGDPDRPLIVGAVYNADNMPPWALPANKTQAGVKSDSSKGHGGYNEIMLEDKKGHEKINVHAQKDLTVTVLNNESRTVNNNMDTNILNAETRTIGKNFKIPTGDVSYKTEVKNGDVSLKIATGSRDTDIAMMDHLKANMMITFECGASKITMTPVSISIEAPLISLSGALIKIN